MLSLSKLSYHVASFYEIRLMIQKFLSLMPYSFHRLMADFHPKMHDYSENIRVRLENYSFLSKYKSFFENKSFLETGTGGSLFDPITFYLLGASSTITFDIVQHSDRNKVWKMIEAYEEHLTKLSSIGNSNFLDVKLRWKKINLIRKNNNFKLFLKVTNIRLLQSQTVPNSITDNSIDVFFSNSVLQRISLRYIEKMFTDVSRVMKSSGIFWHHIDCSDMIVKNDHTKSRYHYLMYGSKRWKLVTSELLTNQNRLRKSDFIKLLSNINYTPIYLNYSRPKDWKRQLEMISLASPFQKYDLDDLSITSIVLLATKKQKDAGYACDTHFNEWDDNRMFS